MKCLSYKEFLNQELDRASHRNFKGTQSHIIYHKYAKKIKRNKMLFIDVELLSNRD